MIITSLPVGFKAAQKRSGGRRRTVAAFESLFFVIVILIVLAVRLFQNGCLNGDYDYE
jgi:hypothetical protein